MTGLYNFAIQCYALSIRIAALFNVKAKLWINGRKDIFKKLKNAGFRETDQIIWIHAASLGEFEQGKPIIEQLKADYPHCKILLTFFSPSGYEIRKDYVLADFVTYLPIDTRHNAQRFIKIIRPQLVIFIKYEFWYHFLNELQKADIPTLLISAVFRKDQFFFKRYGQWFKPVIAGFEHIFVQHEDSAQVLQQQGITKVSVAGDTRIDQVIRIRETKKSFPIVEDFIGKEEALIFGSTWPADEDIILHYVQSNPKKWRYIIAPHDISSARIIYIENLFQMKSLRYSEAAGAVPGEYDLLIIDNIGILSSLYQYGKIAYIGGAFGKGLHNTLEAIVFGLPVIFGLNYQKFEEAKWLVNNSGGFDVRSSNDFEKIIIKLEEEEYYQQASKQAEQYIYNNKGATSRILNFIRRNKLLKNGQK